MIHEYIETQAQWFSLDNLMAVLCNYPRPATYICVSVISTKLPGYLIPLFILSNINQLDGYIYTYKSN